MVNRPVPNAGIIIEPGLQLAKLHHRILDVLIGFADDMGRTVEHQRQLVEVAMITASECVTDGIHNSASNKQITGFAWRHVVSVRRSKPAKCCE